MVPTKWTVLIVDDDPQFCRLVANVAERCGLRAQVASSAQEAWLSMEPEPLLVLLDLNMPDADGIEVLRELAIRRCYAQIRVLSGHDPRILRSAEQIGRDIGLRMGEPLSKPISVALLREVFTEAVRDAEAAAASPLSRSEGASPTPQVSSAELRLAISGGDLFLVYQPILDLATLSPLGSEALVRWRHPTRGTVPPGAFLPLAESCGLVVEMTEQIFAQALAFGSRADYAWEGRPLSISINLPAAALTERDLAKLISSLLASSGVSPARLIVEITESAMRADRTSVLEVLSRLRLRGVEVSIDDFGTGTSSLERLDRFPCTELKIERAFVADVLRRPDAEAIVRSTIELARRLNLRVVAEGIEDAQTLRWLRAAGCGTGQGFLFSRGMEEGEFMKWLAAWKTQRAPLLEASRDVQRADEA